MDDSQEPPSLDADPTEGSSTEDGPQGFDCPTCEASRDIHTTLLLHVRQAHPTTRYTTADFAFPVFLCPECTAPFGNKGAMTRHRKTHSQRDDYDNSAQTGDDTMSKFRALNLLTPRYKPLPKKVQVSWISLVDELAQTYTVDPSAANLYNLLAAAKVGLDPNKRHTNTTLCARLAAYPDCSPPRAKTQRQRHGPTNPYRDIERLTEQGRLRTAARCLANDTPPARLDSEHEVTQLRALHPIGTSFPFTGSSPATYPPTTVIAREDVLESARTINRFSAPGVSGWTVSLLREAIKAPAFVTFLTQLTNDILHDVAPGADMLTCSRLIALPKPNGKLRPIAIGELFYRVAMRAIVRHVKTDECLLPNQLGVGSSGGVEPAIHLLRRAARGDFGDRFTHWASLDAINAFNDIDRPLMASATAKFLPSLHRAARWAYGSSSELLLSGNDQAGAQSLKSSKGVRQGDPAGPLLFSLAVRPFLEELIAFLGPAYLVIAYLDDIFILSKSADTLDKVDSFITDHYDKPPITINPSKSSITALESLRREGIDVLGSHVGPEDTRKSFLEDKIEEQVAVLNRLPNLRHQHALLLLRSSLQLNLRHLQRSLMTSDIGTVSRKMDNAMHRHVLRMLGPIPSTVDTHTAKLLIGLPEALGGCGLHHHFLVAPLAFKAACMAADEVIRPLIDLPEPPPPVVESQKSLCAPAFTLLRDTIYAKLSEVNKVLIHEGASPLGKRWLSFDLSNPDFSLSDSQVAAALASRTLVDPARGNKCPLCKNGDRSLRHRDNCLGLAAHRTVRHTAIQRAIARALRTANGTTVTVEPLMGNRSSRNDIKVRTTSSSRVTPADIDITVTSVLADRWAKHHLSDATPKADVPPLDPSAVFTALIEPTLSLARQQKFQKADLISGYADRHLFKPFVLSAGGILDESASDQLTLWRRSLSRFNYNEMLDKISLALVVSRSVLGG